MQHGPEKVPVKVFMLAMLGGCPALSDADLQRRIDRDGDGAVSVTFGGTDCNDGNPAVHPGAPEVCDALDNDCDGALNALDPDMPADLVEWYLDADKDGFGRDDGMQRSCAVLGGYAHVGGDCDDTDADQRPGQTWYLDGDGDGFGLAERPRQQCERPSAYSLQIGDCDDANNQIHPAATETCNRFDDDCDGLEDADDPGITGVLTWYPDADGDGYGAEGAGLALCIPASTDVLVGGDCDDGQFLVHSGAVDAWYDGIDADCLGNSDHDQDGDGADAVPSGGTDCDDLRSWVFPGAPEICDGVSNACEGAGWDPAAEAGLAHFLPDSGLSPIDHTVGLSSGGTATLVEGGTLTLCAGDWTGQVVVTGGSVTVTAPPAAGVVRLDAGGVGTAIDATGGATSLTVRGLDLSGGTGRVTGAPGTAGGCLYADGVLTVTLSDVDLTGCIADNGGGAWLHADSVAVTDAVFRSNTATDDGGGAHVAGLLTLERTVFQGNSAGRSGGGAFAVAVTGSAIADSTFDLDSAVAGGGGLYAIAIGNLALIGCDFLGNAALLGAGVYQEAGAVQAVSCSFADGVATDGGGGWYLASGALDTLDGAFAGNAAAQGGAIFALGSAACDGTAFLRNDTDAVWVGGAGGFEASACDLGDIPDDNTVDVATPAGGFSFPGVTTVQCSAAGCS